MNEEQAVLEFFAQQANLPLSLSVAELMDQTREQMNNHYWRELLQRFNTLATAHTLPWQAILTEDKNAPDSLVGLHCTPQTGQQLYLRPMIEQQYLGGIWRIYFGLMWNTAPAPELLALPAVGTLQQALQHTGFKSNENFLGWQWTSLHPRRKDFLLRFSQQPATLLDESMTHLQKLLLEHHLLIEQANAALQKAPRSMTISLDQLRGKRSD